MGGRIALLLVIFLCCSISHAEEAVEIPLSEIWAYNMPGTRDVRELEPETYGHESKSLTEAEQFKRFNSSIIQKIRRTLVLAPNENRQGNYITRPPGNGFVVEGIDKAALTKAHAVLAEGQEPRSSYPAGSQLSIVFYSLEAGSYVHLTSVKKQGNKVSLRFQFVSHFTSDASSHFALIPVTDLPLGRIKVEVFQEPIKTPHQKSEKPTVYLDWQDQVICKAFSFTIEETK